MCGISGIISRTDTASLPDVIRKVNDAMSHRGPDADGFLFEEGIALGHRRLSILDLSSAANQPFTDASGRYVMVFNGEIYNFQEIRKKLPDYPFHTSGDTEVVIAAFAKFGPECLQLFRGMFALAIWDKADRSLFLARDRFGVKPLYYYHFGDRFLFASELRALLGSGWLPRRLNRSAVTDYLKYQAFASPVTPIEDVFEVPAGAYMSFRDGRVETKTWWELTAQKKPIAETRIGDIQRRIRELLYQSVERRLVSDVPLGAFLSGGIDSSAVVAIMSQVNPGATNAFTIAFEEKDYNELPYAELIAQKYKVNHTKLLLRPQDFLDQLPEALNAMDTPSGDGLNTYLVSKAIRKSGIIVALSGIGGDELFAGYPFFKQFLAIKKRKTIFDNSFGLRKALSRLLPASDQKMIRIKELLEVPVSDISDIYPIFRQIQNPRVLRRLYGRLQPIEEADTLERNLGSKQQALDQWGFLSQVSIADYLGYTQSVLLKDADQMSMAVSLELREPFFDNDLVEYVLNIPDNFKFPAYPKKLLVESLGDLLPPEIVFRKKQGFVLPYDLWMRSELKGFCEEKIRGLAARGIFEEEKMLAYWKSFLERKSNIRWADIWIFVVLEHWLEKNQVS